MKTDQLLERQEKRDALRKSILKEGRSAPRSINKVEQKKEITERIIEKPIKVTEYKTIEKPVIVEKPVYIEKPFYKEIPVKYEVPTRSPLDIILGFFLGSSITITIIIGVKYGIRFWT